MSESATVTNPGCLDGGPDWCCIDNDGSGLWCESCTLWSELSEADKEADRCIGSALWGDGFKEGLDAGAALGKQFPAGVGEEALDALIEDVRQIANVVGDTMVYARLIGRVHAVEKSRVVGEERSADGGH